MTLTIKPLLIGGLIGLSLAASATVNASIRDGLQAWWTFNDAANLFHDQSGNNNTPQAVIGTPTQGVGKVGAGSLKLDGSSGLRINNTVGSSDNFTISVWAKHDQIGIDGGTQVLVSKIGDGKTTDGKTGFNMYQIVQASSTRQWVVNYEDAAGTGVYTGTGGIARANDWHLVTVTYDGTALSIFINDSLAKTMDTKLIANTDTALTIGLHSTLGDRFWRGDLDEVAIWNRALSQAEISQLATGASIPESSSLSLALGGAVLALLLIRRKRIAAKQH